MTPDEYAILNAKLDKVIRHVEIDRRLIDGFDDRIARLESIGARQTAVSKQLTTAAMQISIARAVTAPSLRMFLSLLLAGLVGGMTAGFAHEAFGKYARASTVSSSVYAR